jgi:hypothetical protein
MRHSLPDVGELSDGVVTLRRVRSGDEDALLDERLDPESRRWATSMRLWTPSDVKIFVGGRTRGVARRRGGPVRDRRDCDR